MQRGSLALHSGLVDALKMISRKKVGAAPGWGTREQVLEQALVEQNQIMDVMQELIASLELETKESQKKIRTQELALRQATLWKKRAQQAEEELHQKNSAKDVVGTMAAGTISFAAIAGLEKTLAQKDQLIALQQSQIAALPPHSGRREPVEESAGLPPSAVLASTRARLEGERMRVIELEEELFSVRKELGRVQGELEERLSVLLAQESEVQHLRHEMNSLKQLSHKQQDLVLQLRNALSDKDTQLASLSLALGQAKETARASALDRMQTSLYEQILSRELVAVDIEPEEGLGFTYIKMELPVSSKVPCLVVKAVQENSVAHGKVWPGDELVEVNGHSCRSGAQAKALACLDRAKGPVQLVLARDTDPCRAASDIPLQSTPLHTSSSSCKSTIWATALSEPYSSFSSSHPLRDSTQDQPSREMQNHQECLAKVVPEKPQPGNGLEAAQERSEPKGLVKAAQEKAEQEGLLEAVQEKAELEGLLQAAWEEKAATHEELDELQLEHDLVKAENYELQQQLSTQQADLSETWAHVAEMEKMLVSVQEQVAEDEQKIASLESCNVSLTTQLEASRTDCKLQKAESEEARKMVASKAETESRLRREVARLTSVIQQLEADISMYKSDLSILNKDIQSKNLEYNHELQCVNEQNAQLTSELRSLQQFAAQAKASDEEVHQLQRQLATAKSLLLQGEKKASEREVEVRGLRQSVDIANYQLALQAEEAKRTSEEMCRFKQLAEAETLEKERVTLSLKTAQSNLEANKQILSRLQEEVDILRRTSMQLQTDISQLETERERAKVKTSSDESEISLLREKLSSSAEERDLLFQQLEEAMEKESALEQQLESSERNFSSAQGQTTELQGAQQEAQDELQVTLSEQLQHEAANKDAREQRGQMEELACKLKEQEDKALRIQLQNCSLQRELEQTQQQLAASGASLEQLQEEVALERCQWKKSYEQLLAKSESVDTEHRRCKDIMSSMELIHREDQLHLVQLKETLQDKETRLESTQAELAMLKEESSAELTHFQAEKSGLSTQVGQLRRQLEEKEGNHSVEVAMLKGRLAKLEHNFAGVREEMKAEQIAGSINAATIDQLRLAVEQAETERDALLKELQTTSDRASQLSREATRTAEKLAQAELQRVKFESTNAAMVTESTLLKHQVAEAREHVEMLRSSLEHAEQSVQGSSSREVEQREANVALSKQLEKMSEELQIAREEKEKSTMQLLHRNEQLSQLKTSTSLQISECKQLREALVSSQSRLAAKEEQIQSLEAEQEHLQESIQELELTKERVCKEVAREQEKTASSLAQTNQRTAVLQQENTVLQASKAELEDQVRELDSALCEARASAKQFLGVQEALRTSFSNLGAEKDGQLLQLSEQVTELEASLLQSRQTLCDEKERGKGLSTELATLRQQTAELSSLCEELEEENERLRVEDAARQRTECQLSELSDRVGSLSRNLQARTERVDCLEEERVELQCELAKVKVENDTLLARVSELAQLKVSLVEQTSSVQQLQGSLAAQVREQETLLSERDRLLAALQRQEVEKHTQAPPPSNSPRESVSMEELQELLRDKEEEAFRLREYVSKLLSSVLERAPFVLENLH